MVLKIGGDTKASFAGMTSLSWGISGSSSKALTIFLGEVDFRLERFGVSAALSTGDGGGVKLVDGIASSAMLAVVCFWKENYF